MYIKESNLIIDTLSNLMLEERPTNFSISFGSDNIAAVVEFNDKIE